MSAGSIPYHLRPNKAVDRFLFLDLCSRLDVALGLNSYQYIGFGGPQMEDFRLLHERFPGMPMLCIEANEGVIPRQHFNQPHSLVEFLDKATKSGEWLENWKPSKPVLLWFDYALKAERNEQINEFQNLMADAPLKSVIRITMNADLPRNEQNSKPDDMLNALKSQFGKLIPPDVDASKMKAALFPAVLSRMLGMAAAAVHSPAYERKFLPLLITSYQDTTQMITVTGLIDTPEAVKQMMDRPEVSQWAYLAKGWDDVRRINMPELTVKERIHINQLLPGISDAAAIQERLNFQVDERADVSLDKLKNYAEFYRHFPQFARVSV